jgi:triosephosphate isomerase
MNATVPSVCLVIIDGGLIGGASLDADSFAAIVEAARR